MSIRGGNRRCARYTGLLPVLVAVCLVPGQPAQAQSEVVSLCEAGERVYFSARVKDAAQHVSVCGAEDPKAGEAWLQYRFGQRYMIDRRMPERREDSLAVFAIDIHTRPRTTYVTLVIHTGDLRVTLSEGFEADAATPHSAGQVISRGEQELQSLELEPLTDPLTLMALQGAVPDLPGH